MSAESEDEVTYPPGGVVTTTAPEVPQPKGPKTPKAPK
jgi:hypothetical protein